MIYHWDEKGEKIVVTGSLDRKMKIWDSKSGELSREVAESDAVWKVGMVGEKGFALFPRNREIIWEVSLVVYCIDCGIYCEMPLTRSTHSLGKSLTPHKAHSGLEPTRKIR